MVWSLSERKAIRKLQPKTGTVITRAISPDGQWLLLRDSDDLVQVINVSSGDTRLRLKADGAAFVGDRLVTCQRDHLRISALVDGTETRHPAQGCLAVIADGSRRRAVINLGGEQLTVMDLYSGKSSPVQLAYAWAAPSLAVGGQELLAAGHAGAVVRGWDLRSGKVVANSGGPGHFRQVALSGNERMLAIVADPPLFNPDPARFGHGIRMFDLKTGAFSRIAESPVSDLRFSGDGGRLLTTSPSIKVWDTRNGQLIRELNDPRFPKAAISPDGLTVAAADVDGETIWRVNDGGLVWRSAVRKTLSDYDQMKALAFTADGRSVLFGSVRGPIYQHDAATGRRQRTLAGHGAMISALAVSRDGRLIASASWDGSMRIWNASSGEAVQTVVAPGAQIRQLAFNADGKCLLAAVSDGTTQLWDPESGLELGRFISFSDGEWIVITPEGYFNGSQRASDHVNVRMGNRLVFLNQFYDTFFRPDIVERKLRGEDISTLIATTMAISLKNPPPEVSFITVPDDKSSDRITVRFRVTSTGGGVGNVRAFHNGKIVQSDAIVPETVAGASVRLASMTPDAVTRGVSRAAAQARQRAGTPLYGKPDVTEVEVSVEAVPSENEITVVAFNRDDSIQSRPESAKFMRPAKAIVPRLYVLAIGINEYVEQPLKNAVKDATEFSQAIQKAAGSVYPRDNIVVHGLRDSAATRKGIAAAVKDIAAKARPWDSFVMFVASHGVLYDGRYAIVTHDFRGELPQGLLYAGELLKYSTAIPALHQLLVLDTCHAGGLNSFARGLYDARMSVFARSAGLHIFAAASETQEAIDGYRGNGLFTHALLAAFRDPLTDRNRDRDVSVLEFGGQARRTTQEIGARIKYRQSPEIMSFGKDTTLYRIGK